MNSDVYRVPSNPSMLVYFRASMFFREHNGKMKSAVKPTITLERLEMLGPSPNDANICEKESPVCIPVTCTHSNKHSHSRWNCVYNQLIIIQHDTIDIITISRVATLPMMIE
jgi:hypothetical protein